MIARHKDNLLLQSTYEDEQAEPEDDGGLYVVGLCLAALSGAIMATAVTLTACGCLG